MERKIMEDELENISEEYYQPKMELGELKQSNNNESKKKQHHSKNLQSSLAQELQIRLQQQFVIRHALEKACYLPFSQDATVENSIPKAAKELIMEIGILELEVVYLEQHLLSLYRKRFDQQISPLTTKETILESSSDTMRKTSAVPGEGANSNAETSFQHSSNLISHSNSADFQIKECNNLLKQETVLDSSIIRCHSELSHRTVCSIEASSPVNIKSKTVDNYHSLPLSMLEQAQNAKSSSTSLAEHLGNGYVDNVPETPNWLSEEMIKCISAIYCDLTESPFLGHKNASPPLRFSSSGFELSSQNQGTKWGSKWKKHPSFNLNSSIPFHVKGSKEFSGPYCSMVRIQQLCTDSQKLKEIDYMLRRFRSLVSRLVDVNPRYMKHKEKLAFWINVHNALAMHALLVYGISANNVKRMSSVQKAAYNIGGHTISVDQIQNFILGCRLPRPGPGQWLRLWCSSKTKPKVRDGRKGYAIHRPEPLLLFALCSGSHSDPAVRLYTSKRVLEELELAKEEYIKSTITITKEHKLVLPKIVDSFAKNSGLEASDLMEIVNPYLPDSQRKSIRKFQSKASWKGIELAPHNFNFHYLISKDLAW
ncbi:putative ternary complex factor MIP1, leucine-zipper [Lupinus albus]|uniref:Putative ternary complex factor MIP1, leucine-zipper n=1 Tax=Lupinus albus TaxID=3870 RepID=A0A6A4R324_LUPAL|nr:putative ternary complex factor MIP1, leucine-zipper [Lupinus albus]